MFSVFCLSIGAVAVGCYYFTKFAKFLYGFCRIPGPWLPWNLQFCGLVLSFVGKSEAERLNILRDLSLRFPLTLKIWFGHMFLIAVQSPEVLQKIFSSTAVSMLEKPDFYKFFGFGDGLITANVKSWKPHRRVLNNAFTVKAIHGFMPIFDECAKNFVTNLKPHAGDGPFNILQYAVKCTLDNICCKIIFYSKLKIIDKFTW